MRDPREDSPEERRFLIRTDMREQNSRVVPWLTAYADIRLEFSALPNADYVLSDSVAVERKEAGDFASSIIDRRLFGQAAKMKAEFERPILLIEGDLSGIRSGISPDALRGAVSFITVLEGITVVQTATAQETAALLRTMVRHAQEGLGYQTSLREPKPKATNLYAEYLVEGLPGVGRHRAQQLLLHFGTPAAIMRASAEGLGRVAGIGPKGALQIWNALNTGYIPEADGTA